jgi:hypothetical protein
MRLQLHKADLTAYSFYAFVLAMMLWLSGCRQPVPPVVVAESRFEIEMEQHHGIAPDAGRKESDIIAVLTVPTATVVTGPTGTRIVMVDTVIKVYKEKKTIRETLFRKQDEAKTPVEVVANNASVTAAYPEVTPWWWYVLSFLTAAAALWAIIARFFDAITGPLQIIKKLLGK